MVSRLNLHRLPRVERALTRSEWVAMAIGFEQFTDALHKGLGRALQDTLATGALSDERAVIEACVHNQSYDPQVEGTRTAWMLEILDAANALPRVGTAILDAFAVATDCWDLCQLCEFAEVLARR